MKNRNEKLIHSTFFDNLFLKNHSTCKKKLQKTAILSQKIFELEKNLIKIKLVQLYQQFHRKKIIKLEKKSHKNLIHSTFSTIS